MRNNFWKGHGIIIIALMCAFLLIAGSLISFVYRVNADARLGMKLETEAIRDNYVRVLSNELNYLKRLTETVAQLFGEVKCETEEVIVSQLQDYAKAGDIVRTLFISDEGDSYTNYSGYLGKIEENKSLDGKLIGEIMETYFSKPFYAEDLNEVIFGVVVPTDLACKKGVLISSYDVADFRELFKSNFLDGGSHVGIVDKYGQVIMGDRANSQPTNFGVDIFHEFFENKVEFSGSSMESMREDLLNGKEGFVIYNYAGIERYCAYAPVGINDWYVIAMAPQNVLEVKVESIKKRGLQLSLELLAIMTALLLAVVAIRHRDQQCTRRELEEAAMVDGLTRIYNRAAVEHTIMDYLAGEGAQGSHALLAMDIDDFKLINDSFGHVAGDTVLIEFAHQINMIVGKEDIVGRMGGDEFIALLKNCDDLEIIRAKADKIVNALVKQQAAEALAISTTISIGIALFPSDGSSFLDLYQHADDALYKTKQQGKNGFSFYIRS